MDERPSRTAEYMALFRALETARPDRLFDDPLATAFLDRPLRAAVLASRVPLVGRLVPWYIDRRWPGPRPSGVARTRVIDDAVREAIAAGSVQLVLLGAGYDTRPYRLRELDGVDVFEVDHPVTQAEKRRVLERRLRGRRGSARFVPVDFECDSLEQALDAAGFAGGAITCVLWEGVFSYLTPDAIDRTLAWVGGSCAAGSRLILTYVDQAALDGADRESAWVGAVAAAGEPFITGLDPPGAPTYFAERGLRLLSDEPTRESAERLGLAAADTIPGFYRVAILELA